MLVLSRERNESIIVGTGANRAVITIVDVNLSNGRVKLGIEAPLNVQVDRLELREAKERRAAE